MPGEVDVQRLVELVLHGDVAVLGVQFMTQGAQDFVLFRLGGDWLEGGSQASGASSSSSSSSSAGVFDDGIAPPLLISWAFFTRDTPHFFLPTDRWAGHFQSRCGGISLDSLS